MFTREMRGEELAHYLTDNLTDLEFELLMRYRMQKLADKLLVEHPNFSASHTSFTFDWKPEGNSNGWRADVGINYNKYDSAKGEVLSLCITNAINQLEARFANKISGLLGSPVTDEASDISD